MKKILFLWTFLFMGSYLSICQEISEEAKKFYDNGCTALEMIKDNEQFVDYNDAIMEFNKAKELAPNFKNVYLKLGQIYSKLKKYQEAIENYKKYIQFESDKNEVSKVNTIINKLEYKSKKNRELMPSIYKDVNIYDFVEVSWSGDLYPGSYEKRWTTIKCIEKDDSIVRLEIGEKVLSVSKGEITRNEFKTKYRTHSISDTVGGYVAIMGYPVENIREIPREEKKIDEGIKYLKINNTTLRCYWLKTKNIHGGIYERWFSNKIPLVYLIKQTLYIDGKVVGTGYDVRVTVEVTSWGRLR